MAPKNLPEQPSFPSSLQLHKFTCIHVELTVADLGPPLAASKIVQLLPTARRGLIEPPKISLSSILFHTHLKVAKLKLAFIRCTAVGYRNDHSNILQL